MRKISCSAPARVDLSGGAADIFGLTTMSAAIDVRATCTIEETNGETTLDVGNGEIPMSEAKGSSYDILLNIIKRFNIGPGLKIKIGSDIPRSSGLGGSASIAVSVVKALSELRGFGLSDYAVAEHAQRIETLGMKLKNGYQDQYTSTFGGCIFMDFKDKENKDVGEEPYAVVERMPFKHNIVVAHTGTKHNSGDVNSIVYDKFHARDKTVVDSVMRLDDLTRRLRTSLIDDDYGGVCNIVNENQEIIRIFKRSYPENERLIRTALDRGADAAKVTGAGCGGSIAAICKDVDTAEFVAECLREMSPYVKVCRIDEGVRNEL